MKFVVSKIVVESSKLHYTQLSTRPNYPTWNIFLKVCLHVQVYRLQALYVGYRALIDNSVYLTLRRLPCLNKSFIHPGVCNNPLTVYAPRYALLIRSSFSSMLSSIERILRDVSREA